MKPKERNFFSCFPVGSFFRSLEKTSEKVYLVLLCFYLAVFLNARICWTSPLDKVMVYVRVAMMSIVIWGTALYFFAFAADWRGLWKRTGLLAALAVPVFGGAGIFSRSMTMRTFNLVVDLWFCFFACGKSFD